MLKLLLKYDLKKILKFLVWFYAIGIALAGISRLLNIWGNIQIIKIIATVFTSLTYSAIATILINTFIHILLRFSTSFYKDQSYLTHTLPVKKETLILSKFISALIVILSSVFTCFLCLFILFYSHDFMQSIKFIIESAVKDFDMSSGLFVCLLAIVIFAQICAMISMAFTAIVKGYSYNHKRGLKGFLWFALYYILGMLSTLILAVIVSLITGNLDTLFAETMSSGAFVCVLITTLVVYFAYAVLFFFICKREFNKGVNVD